MKLGKTSCRKHYADMNKKCKSKMQIELEKSAILKKTWRKCILRILLIKFCSSKNARYLVKLSSSN